MAAILKGVTQNEFGHELSFAHELSRIGFVTIRDIF
jgi:hypothetical protein